jgi:hypothetical protein
MPRVERYDLRETNGIRWYRLRLAPLDFLIDPGIYMRDTRVLPPPEHGLNADEREGFGFRHYRIQILPPQLYFDHGTPRWAQRVKRLLRQSS